MLIVVIAAQLHMIRQPQPIGSHPLNKRPPDQLDSVVTKIPYSTLRLNSPILLMGSYSYNQNQFLTTPSHAHRPGPAAAQTPHSWRLIVAPQRCALGAIAVPRVHLEARSRAGREDARARVRVGAEILGVVVVVVAVGVAKGQVEHEREHLGDLIHQR
eukprot:2241091-Pyramimonas_sp.AAC.1